MPQTTRAISGAPGEAVERPSTPTTDFDPSVLTLNEEYVGRRAVLSVAGEVDISNVAHLRRGIEGAATRAFELWLDLSDLTFMDSSGLHAIADARARLTDASTRLTLICPEGPVLRALTLAGFDRSFEIHDSRTAANHATFA